MHSVVTFVAVHGNGGSASRFERVVPHLPPGFRLHAVTLPGFGGVPRDPAIRTLAEYADRLATLADAAPRPRVLLGHGIGGSIVLDLLQRRPAAADAVILHAPVGARLDRRLFPKLMALPGARALGRRLFASPLTRPMFRRAMFSRPVPSEFVDRFFDDYRRCRVFADVFDWLTLEWFRSLRPVSVPALILWGADDRVLGAEQAADYQPLLPGCALRIVPGWDHFPMMEQPEDYAKELMAVSRRLLGGPGGDGD